MGQASVTERVRVGEDTGLTINTAELDEVLEAVPDLILIHDGEGRNLYVSPSTARHLGRDRDAILGRTWREIGLSPEALEPFDHARQRVMATGEPVKGETSLAGPEGPRRCEYTLSPILGPEGQVAGTVAIIRDATERKLAEAERERLVAQLTLERERAESSAEDAQRRAAELDAIISSIDEAVNVYSPQGVLVRANPAAVAEFGFNPEGMRRDELFQRLNPRRPDGTPFTPDELPSTRGLRGERVDRQRLLFTDAQGRERTALVSVSPFSSDGKVQGAVGIWNDVTELERALEELSAERARLEAVVEQMPVGVVIAEAPSERVILANRRAREILELPTGMAPHVADLIRYPLQLRHADGCPCPPEEYPVARALRTGEPVTGEEVVLTRSDGTQVVLSINSGPIRRHDGRVIAAVSAFHNITEHRAAERERDAARQKLLEAERERKNFYRNVIRAITHDRFCLVEPQEVPTEGRLILALPLEDEESYHALRTRLRDVAMEAGMDEARAKDTVLAAGEAAINAVRHGVDPRAAIYSADDRVLVRVCDKGEGIRPEDLPSTIFRRGFSTRVSLGMGYTIMLELADRLWLATGPEGTTLQIEKRVHPEEIPAGSLPAAWENL